MHPEYDHLMDSATAERRERIEFEAGRAAAYAVYFPSPTVQPVSRDTIRQMASASVPFARGYDAAAQQLTGGHAKSITQPTDEVKLARETVEQLVDAIERLSNSNDDVPLMELNNILPHLKRAL